MGGTQAEAGLHIRHADRVDGPYPEAQLRAALPSLPPGVQVWVDSNWVDLGVGLDHLAGRRTPRPQLNVSANEELARLDALCMQGGLSREEFDQAKAHLLMSASTASLVDAPTAAARPPAWQPQTPPSPASVQENVMGPEDLRRLTSLRDKGVITHAEFMRLTEPPSATTQPGRPRPETDLPPPWGTMPQASGRRLTSVRLGDLAGTAAAAMAGALAGNALERILSSDPSADEMADSTEAAADGSVEWFYSQDTEFVDSNGDGSLDGAWTSESLLIDDGTPALYSHTEYAEYADTDGDGVSDALVTLESNVSYAEWGGDGTPDADIGWSEQGFDV